MSSRQWSQRDALSSSGVPRYNNSERGRQPQRRGIRPRDFYRMEAYNEQRADGDWAKMVEADDRATQARSRVRSGPRSQPQRRNIDIRSTVASEPRDELIYDGEAAASRPVTTQLGHNLDYSGFAVLIEEAYRQCESENPRMQRELPFCVYQHAMVEHLNAFLLHMQKFENADPRFQDDADPLEIINAKDFYIPRVVHEYISGIGKSLTATGESVRVNLPTAGTPRGNEDPLTSGSFGAITAETHNAYECYWSPFISQKMIERTHAVNTAARKDFGPWNPFPAGTFPDKAVLNENLLGYHLPQRLHSDALNVISDCNFDEGNTMSGRLCHSAACIERTSLTLSRLKTIESTLATYKPTENAAIFISKQKAEPVLGRLVDYNASLGSPFAFGQSVANRAAYFGYKRRRTIAAPGVCLSVGGVPPEAFIPTRNYNYTMQEPFQPLAQMRDRVSLREINHLSSESEGQAQLAVSAWLARHFRKKMTIS